MSFLISPFRVLLFYHICYIFLKYWIIFLVFLSWLQLSPSYYNHIHHIIHCLSDQNVGNQWNKTNHVISQKAMIFPSNFLPLCFWHWLFMHGFLTEEAVISTHNRVSWFFFFRLLFLKTISCVWVNLSTHFMVLLLTTINDSKCKYIFIDSTIPKTSIEKTSLRRSLWKDLLNKKSLSKLFLKRFVCSECHFPFV